MKRVLAVLLIGLMLTGIAITVLADPINVGGEYTLSSSTRGPAVFKGKGDPQGVPFQIPTVELCSTPINVGGE